MPQPAQPLCQVDALACTLTTKAKLSRRACHAGHRLLRKSMEVANWLKASTDAALSLEPSSKQVRHCEALVLVAKTCLLVLY